MLSDLENVIRLPFVHEERLLLVTFSAKHVSQ